MEHVKRAESCSKEHATNAKWTVDECLKVRVKSRKDLNRRGRNKQSNFMLDPFGSLIRKCFTPLCQGSR